MNNETMFICCGCIRDKFIKSFIELSQEKINLDDCPFCGSKNQSAISSSLLSEYINKCIQKLYHKIEVPNDITDQRAYDIEALNDDISSDLKEFTGTIDITLDKILNSQVFSEHFIEKENRTFLINFAQELGYSHLFETLERNDCYNRDKSNIEKSWSEFVDTVKYSNRYFSQNNNPRDELLKQLDGLLVSCSEEIEQGRIFYRVRIVDMNNYSERELWEDQFYNKNIIMERESSPAPAKNTRDSRLSPCGISYTYLTNNEDTGLSECRISSGQDALISSFKTKKKLTILNLSNSQNTWTNIFWDKYDIKNQCEQDFITTFISEISKPISIDDRNISYIPTQVLAEYIRFLGYDGIAYNSSVSAGINYVLFCGADTNKFPEHQIPDVTINIPSYSEFLEFINANWFTVQVKNIYSLENKLFDVSQKDIKKI